MCYNLIGQRCVLHEEWSFIESSLVLQCNFLQFSFLWREDFSSFFLYFFLSINISLCHFPSKKKNVLDTCSKTFLGRCSSYNNLSSKHLAKFFSIYILELESFPPFPLECLGALHLVLDCMVLDQPIPYLGLPLGGNPKASAFWDPMIERVS